MFKNIFRGIMLCLICISALNAQSYHGVAVGINDYPGTINDLQYCVADAQDLRYCLINYQAWSAGNIQLITNGGATQQGIFDAIGAMPRTSGNTDWFSYSGHGSTAGLWTVDQENLSPSELQSQFGGSYSQYCSYLDACQTGVFPANMTTGVISSACRSDEYASEGSQLGHGTFSYYLIEGLTNSAAGGGDGIVTAEELHSYAAPRTTSYDSDMHPQLTDNWSGSLDLRTVLSAAVDGPEWLPSKAYGTWTAITSGGSGNVSYQWYEQDDGSQNWTTLGTAQQQTYRMPIELSITIRCDVHDNVTAENVSPSLYVYNDGLRAMEKRANDAELVAKPTDFSFAQNYPNPFNPETQISFGLPEPADVGVTISDLLGREVVRLTSARYSAGYHSVRWLGTDASGSKVGSGIYFYRINAVGESGKRFTKVVKMLLAK